MKNIHKITGTGNPAAIKLLDVGCSSSFQAFSLARKGYSVTGLEKIAQNLLGGKSYANG